MHTSMGLLNRVLDTEYPRRMRNSNNDIQFYGPVAGGELSMDMLSH